MAESQQPHLAVPVSRGFRRRTVVIWALVLAGCIWLWMPFFQAMWVFSQGDRLTMTIINETGQPVTGLFVHAEMGFSAPLDDVGPGATDRTVLHFGGTQGSARLTFFNGGKMTQMEMGMLLDDDGPYTYVVRIFPDHVRVTAENNEPARTYSVER